MSAGSFFSSALRTFFERLFAQGPGSRAKRLGPVLLLFLLFLVIWGVSGRVEAQFSACTHVLTDDQIEKLTGLPVARRSADHDDKGCVGSYQAKRRDILTVRIVRAAGAGSFINKVGEAREMRGFVVEPADDFDDPAVFLRRKSDGEVTELWVSRPAASGRLEIAFLGGPLPKEIDEGRLVSAVKAKLAFVDEHLRDLAGR